MRILMVLESDFPPDTRVENEIQALIDAKCEVHIACISRRKDFQNENKYPYTIHKKYMPPLVHKASVAALKMGLYFRFWQRFLNKVLVQHSFDRIHIHDLPLARVGYRLGRKFGIPMTLDLHENWPALLNVSLHTKTFLGRLLSSQRQWEKYEAWSIRHADQLIVVVDEAKDRIAGLGVDPAKIHVVSNTINPEHFSFPPPIKEEEFITIVYGGGVTYHRGLQTVIEAVPLLNQTHNNLRLWIIGDGSYMHILKTLAFQLGVEDQVTFFGWMPLKELLKHVSKANIALIPHIKSPHTDSTIPHKLFQYMYAGIPILTSDCAPLERIVTETCTGISFKNQDAGSFAKNLSLLLSDAEFREKIPENGKKWIHEKYNWKVDAKRLVDIYM